MSADNIIYVLQVGKKYKVWEQSASNDMNPKGMKPKIFNDFLKAYDYAEELQEFYEYVEYGIHVIRSKQ